MKIEAGKEVEFAVHRLIDIIFLAERTEPVDGMSWEEYTKEVLGMIANQARNAQNALSLKTKA